MKGVPKAVLACIAAVACLSMLIAVSYASNFPAASELLGTNAVMEARKELQQAANSDNLAELNEAIARGESVLKAVRSVNSPARTQSLAEVSTSQLQEWRQKAEQAAAKVEHLDDIQKRARADAANAKRAEEEWMKRAMEARKKARELAESRSSLIDPLEQEKRELKARLRANEEKIKHVEETADQVADSHLDALRQTSSGGHTVQALESELQRQIREYKEAQVEVSRSSREAMEEATEHAKERQLKEKQHVQEQHLMDEINHIKQARHALLASPQSGSSAYESHGRRTPMQQPRRVDDKATLIAKERKIEEEIAEMDSGRKSLSARATGFAGADASAAGDIADEERARDRAALNSAAVKEESSRALADDPAVEDSDFSEMRSMRSRGTSKLAKMHETSVVSAFEHALGDAKEDASTAESGRKQAKKAAASGQDLPGVNAYSWWSNKSEVIAAKKAQLAAIRSKLHRVRHSLDGKGKDPNCHNLYSCIGSMFSGEEDSAKLAHANKLTMHKQMMLAQRAKPLLTGDTEVAARQVLQNPQAPLLGILSPDSYHAHSQKLPGIVESRWGGSKFFDRLFGSASRQADTPHAHHAH